MAIVKRLGPEERFMQRHGETWNRIKHVPLIAGHTNTRHTKFIDPSPLSLSNLIDSFSSARWISEVPMDVKVFFYLVELVCDRAGIPGLLPEDFLTQMKRHMNALTTLEKFDTMDGVSFPFRQTAIWDIPAFMRRYPRPGTYPLPSAPRATTAPKIKPKPRPAAPAKPLKRIKPRPGRKQA